MKPSTSAKNVSGDFDKFTDFMRRLTAVPHAELKARLDAEKEAKQAAKTSSSSSARASHDRD